VNEDALRALVRETIARVGAGQASSSAPDPTRLVDPAAFASNFKYNLTPTADGSCVIEPNVRCNHCGYCLSHGH
jgi:hypothetical protein